MVDVDTGRFTVGVFQDVAWAREGLDALKQAGLAAESLTILAKESPEVAALIERALGAPASGSSCRRSARCWRAVRCVDGAAGPARDLAKLGLAGTMRRVGFQAHDGRIFEALTAAAACWWRFTASRARPTRWPSCTRTAAETPRLAPGPDASSSRRSFGRSSATAGHQSVAAS